MGQKVGAVPLFRRELEPLPNTMLPGPRPTLVPSGTLIHPPVWPQQTWAEKWGAAVALFCGGSWVPSNTMSPGSRPGLHAKWHLDPSSRLATTDRKLGAVPLWGRGAGSPSTVTEFGQGLVPGHILAYLHAKFHLDTSSRLATIHQVTDRQDRQTV